MPRMLLCVCVCVCVCVCGCVCGGVGGGGVSFFSYPSRYNGPRMVSKNSLQPHTQKVVKDTQKQSMHSTNWGRRHKCGAEARPDPYMHSSVNMFLPVRFPLSAASLALYPVLILKLCQCALNFSKGLALNIFLILFDSAHFLHNFDLLLIYFLSHLFAPKPMDSVLCYTKVPLPGTSCLSLYNLY